jgi:hypothetical protein
MISDFMEYLKETEPLPPGIELEVVLVNKKSLGKCVLGSDILALFESHRGSMKAKLTVATKGKSKRSILSGVAHEYYHAVQWFRDGLCVRFEDGVDAFLDYEAEAEGFGYRMAVGWPVE